jgi:diaminopimelate decarboxylase
VRKGSAFAAKAVVVVAADSCMYYFFLHSKDAVKCNPDPVIVRTLAINFDCASRNEIRLVQEHSKDLERKPEIIYANPCKS